MTLDNVGYVHMNGRVYDPQLGRFLSVDPVFQFPTNTQSLNPYSYVLNNPLSLTDPTGYSADHNSTPAKPCPQGTASCSGVDAFSGSTELKASISADAIENIQKGANGGLIINLKDGSSFQVDSVSFDVTKDGNTTHVDENFGDSHGHGAGVTITGNGNNASQGVSNVNQSQTAADATMPAQQQKQTGSNPAGGNAAAAEAQLRVITPCEEGDCRVPNSDSVPSGLVLDGKEDHGSFSSFHYKLVNARGKTLTGPGYSLREHLWVDKAHTIHKSIGGNSEKDFVPLVNGEFIDDVGYKPGFSSPSNFNLFQTFDVRYPGGPENGITLPTEFEHITTVGHTVGGTGIETVFTNRVIDVTPNN